MIYLEVLKSKRKSVGINYKLEVLKGYNNLSKIIKKFENLLNLLWILKREQKMY